MLVYVGNQNGGVLEYTACVNFRIQAQSLPNTAIIFWDWYIYIFFWKVKIRKEEERGLSNRIWSFIYIYIYIYTKFNINGLFKILNNITIRWMVLKTYSVKKNAYCIIIIWVYSYGIRSIEWTIHRVVLLLYTLAYKKTSLVRQTAPLSDFVL
jgi:hypothetical protein